MHRYVVLCQKCTKNLERYLPYMTGETIILTKLGDLMLGQDVVSTMLYPAYPSCLYVLLSFALSSRLK